MSAIIIFTPVQSVVMVGISTYCLLEKTLTDALDQLTPLTTLIEVVDEAPHFVNDSSLFECYSSDLPFMPLTME